jgi:selenocysteine lyase/cysteine desulfurase
MKTNSTRRNFIHKSLATLGVLTLPSVFNESAGNEIIEFNNLAERSLPGTIESDESLWQYVRQSFTHSPNIMNLNNGGVCPQPRVVQDAFERYNRLSNEGPAYYMWQVVGKGRETVRQNLSKLAGCSADEVAIVRNTSEALETVIFGLNLKKGDEVVLTKQDYPNMVNAWKQREKRDGIVLKWVNLPQPLEDDSIAVNLYLEQFTSRTKIVEIMHMINWNGQILPVRKIADEAHKRGIEVMVDSAHTFAHLFFTIPGLHCDYFGTSLHKWLYSPFGTGMLYVKKEKIKNLWPLTAPENPESDDIRKFEAMGTRSFPAEVAIGTALEFHEMLGAQRKENRLRYLKEYWMQGLSDIRGIKFYTSRKPEFACGLGVFSVDGIQPADIQSKLFSNYNIYTISVKTDNIDGLRITPNVYTSTGDLDKFIDAVHSIVKSA